MHSTLQTSSSWELFSIIKTSVSQETDHNWVSRERFFIPRETESTECGLDDPLAIMEAIAKHRW